MEIHKDFIGKDFIYELKTGFALFEDNALFPWIILVHKKSVKNMLFLNTEERLELMKDIEICEKVINNIYSPFQTNIAIFGNKTPHLHVHIIARREDDACFPSPAFQVSPKAYTLEQKHKEITKLKTAFQKECV